MGDMVEVTRWVRLVPQYTTAGTVKAMEVAGMTKSRPKDMGTGALVRVTFRVPKAVFSPLPPVQIEFTEFEVASAEVLVADLSNLVEELKA